MGSRTDVAKQYLQAQQSRDTATIESLPLADDVTIVSPRGNVDGKAAVLDRLKNPPQRMGGGGGGGGGMMGQITFGDPVEDGSTVKVEAQIPPNPMVQGMSWVFSFNDQDQINRIEMVVKR